MFENKSPHILTLTAFFAGLLLSLPGHAFETNNGIEQSDETIGDETAYVPISETIYTELNAQQKDLSLQIDEGLMLDPDYLERAEWEEPLLYKDDTFRLRVAATWRLCRIYVGRKCSDEDFQQFLRILYEFPWMIWDQLIILFDQDSDNMLNRNEACALLRGLRWGILCGQLDADQFPLSWRDFRRLLRQWVYDFTRNKRAPVWPSFCYGWDPDSGKWIRVPCWLGDDRPLPPPDVIKENSENTFEFEASDELIEIIF